VGHSKVSIVYHWVHDGLLTVDSGPWIVVPAFMSYTFGNEILDGLEQAAGLPQKKRN
jgi:hypothetical protein